MSDQGARHEPGEQRPELGGRPEVASRRQPSRRSVVVGAAAAATTALAAAVGAGSSLVGCEASTEQDADAAGSVADPVAVTWYANSITQSQNDPRRILAGVFARDNLGMAVDVIAGDASTDAMRANLSKNIVAGNTRPDVFLGDVIWPADFAACGVALPLDELFDETFWRRYEDSRKVASSYGGRPYAAPFFAEQGVLYYRKDLVGPPPTTWHELAAMARKVRRTRPSIQGFVWQGHASEGLTCCWAELTAGAGAPLPTAERPDARLDTPEARDALRFLVGLIREGLAPAAVKDFLEPQALRVFKSGEAVFMRGWNAAWSSINDQHASREVVGNVGVAPLPTFGGAGLDGRHFSTVGGWSLFVNPNSSQRVTAGRFVDWMTQENAQKILARFGVIPTNAVVENDADLARFYEPLRAVASSTPVYRPAAFPNYPDLSQAIYQNVHRALADDVDPEVALRDADEQFHQARQSGSGGG